MPRQFTLYWDQKEIKRLISADLPNVDGANSNLKSCARLEPGDVLWIVNVHPRYRLLLVGRLVVHKVRDRGAGSDFRWRIEGAPSQVEHVRLVQIRSLIRKIRFENSSSDRLKLANGKLDHQQLRQLRQLSSSTAQLFDEAWQNLPAVEESDETQVRRRVGAGFGSSENNQKVERVAVRETERHYRSLGWVVESVESERVGYDLLCKKGSQELHVEVKGISADGLDFILTAGEWKQSQNDPSFRLVIVNNAIRKPYLIVLTKSQLNRRFGFKAIAYRAVEKKSH